MFQSLAVRRHGTRGWETVSQPELMTTIKSVGTSHSGAFVMITETTMPQPSQTELIPKPLKEKSTSLLSDFHAKIYQLLESGKAYQVVEAVYSLKRRGLLGSADPIFLSLKTSKGFYQATTEKTLKSFCEKLPTLGFMSANGNLSILLGYYPKIESGYTLSGILQEASEVDEKYFLSQLAEEKVLSRIKEEIKQSSHSMFINEPKFRQNELSDVCQSLKVGGDLPNILQTREEK